MNEQDVVFVNGQRISYADWRAKMDSPLLAPLPPSERAEVAWRLLVSQAHRA